MAEFGISREARRDAARVGVQTLVATGATYLVMTWLDWPHLTWGVISAIFVIQLNSDTSLIAGAGRVAGTALGTLFGLAATWLVGGEGEILLRLVITTAAANAVAAIWPRLNYGAVAAVAIAVQPNPEFSDALEQAIAIAIGAVIGTGATFTVWPEFGRNRARRMLEYALQDCRELILCVLSPESENDDARRRDIHARFVDHLATARSVLSDSRFRTRLKNGRPMREVVEAVENLWYALVLLDRGIAHEGIDIAREDSELLKGHVTQVQQEAAKFLEAMVAYLRRGKIFPQMDSVRQTLEDARRCAEANLAPAPSQPDAGRALRVLLFALEEVADNLQGLHALTYTEDAQTGTTAG